MILVCELVSFWVGEFVSLWVCWVVPIQELKNLKTYQLTNLKTYQLTNLRTQKLKNSKCFFYICSCKRTLSRIRMKNTTPVRHTLRFRRWSRKAYAAFASIGRCVTIGCLRKSVADSSLSKQKAAGTGGHTGCCEDSTWKGTTEGRETDIGIPLGNETALIFGMTGSGMNLQILLGTKVVDLCRAAGKYLCSNAGRQDKYILKQRNNTGTDYRDSNDRIRSHSVPDNPCLFLVCEFFSLWVRDSI